MGVFTMNKLADKVALVTGASSGIGQAIAIRLAREGATVAVHYHRSKDGALETKRDIEQAGGKAVLLHADLANAEQFGAMVAQFHKEFPALDILINNAGAAIERRPFLEADDDFWHVSFQVNLMSAVRCTRAFLPGMMEKGWGRIVHISSSSARNGTTADSMHYAVMKGGINTFTKSLANHVASFGITVNAVAPGFINTPFQTKTPSIPVEQIIQRIPVGRAGTPEDISPLVAFLATDEASFITGEVYTASGGL